MTAFPEATSATFDELAMRPDELVLVDFFTADCLPCRKLEPMLAAVVRSAGPALRVVRVDAAAAQELAEQFEVQGVPTLLLLKDGRLLDRRSGFQTAHQLRAWVSAHLAAGANR